MSVNEFESIFTSLQDTFVLVIIMNLKGNIEVISISICILARAYFTSALQQQKEEVL